MSATDSTDNDGDGRLREQVKGWLEAEQWTLEEPAPGEKVAWVVVGTDSRGRKILVVRLRDRPDALQVQASLNLPQPIQQALTRLPPGKRDGLLCDLQLQLLAMNVGFAGVRMPLRVVNLWLRVFPEELRRTEFVAAVDRVRNALLAVGVSIRRRIGQSPAKIEYGEFVH